MLAILDYKSGNQTSVARALEHLGIACTVTANPTMLHNADGIIFPGVGAAGQAMEQLLSSGLDTALRTAVNSGKPILGICLGCQIMLSHSEENNTQTLGFVEGECCRFSSELTDEPGGAPIRIPHMGWNTLDVCCASPLLEGIPSDAAFYFVHSYYVRTAPENIIATCTYGTTFCAIYGRDGLWAVQFHPEKSGKPGLRLLSNFNTWCMAHA